MKITIYVDHDKHIHTIDKDDFNWSATAFLCLASVMLFVFMLVPLLKIIEYYKNNKKTLKIKRKNKLKSQKVGLKN